MAVNPQLVGATGNRVQAEARTAVTGAQSFKYRVRTLALLEGDAVACFDFGAGRHGCKNLPPLAVYFAFH